MPENSIVRMLSVLAVMTAAGFISYPILMARLKKRGIEEAAAQKQSHMQARKNSVIAGFLYMVFMVSLVSFFL